MAESLEAEIRQLYEDWIANPSPVVCARLADRLRIAGRNDEALEVSRRGQKDWPGNNSIRMVIARCLRSSGDMQEARTAFEEVLRTDPFNLVALKNLAEMSMAEGRYRDAVKLFGDNVFENPGDPEAQQQLEEAKRRERTAPEPTPVPPRDEAVPAPEAASEPQPAPSAPEAPVPAESVSAVEQAFSAEAEAPSGQPPTGLETPPEAPRTPVQEAPPVEEALQAGSTVEHDTGPSSSDSGSPAEPGASPEDLEQKVAGDATASLQTMFGGPVQDSGQAAAQAVEPAGVPEPVIPPAPEASVPSSPAPEAAPEPGPAVPDEEAASTPFPQTGRMERILRNQGMAVPESHPAPAESRPAAAAHNPEPRTPQGLKREPRSLFDLFSPEERAELFLEPYRQEEK